VVLALFGMLLCWTRFLRTGRWLAGSSLAALLVLGLSPAANWLMLPLEARFPVPDLKDRRIDGVIVLGGTVQERQTLAHGSLTLNDASERVVAMADLARRYPDARILFTGGAGSYSRAPKPEAEVLQSFIGTLGLPAGRIRIESRSVNTYENAVLSKEIMAPRAGETWLLVTSAWHMPRSVGIFRAAGWPVLAYPVDFRTAGSKDRTRGFASVSEGLRRTEVATREWLGLLVYRLTSKTDALFPAP